MENRIENGLPKRYCGCIMRRYGAMEKFDKRRSAVNFAPIIVHLWCSAVALILKSLNVARCVFAGGAGMAAKEWGIVCKCMRRYV